MNDTCCNKAPTSDSPNRVERVAGLYHALDEHIKEARALLGPWATAHDLTTRMLTISLETGGYRVVLMLESEGPPLFIEVAEGVVDGGDTELVFAVWTSLTASQPLAVHKYGRAAVITAFTWLFGYKVRTELESKNLRALQESGVLTVAGINLTERLWLELFLPSTDSGCTAIHLHLPGGVFGMARVQATGSAGYTLQFPGGHTENVAGDIDTAVLLAFVRMSTADLCGDHGPRIFCEFFTSPIPPRVPHTGDPT